MILANADGNLNKSCEELLDLSRAGVQDYATISYWGSSWVQEWPADEVMEYCQVNAVLVMLRV